MNHYGEPPNPQDCKPVEAPPNLVLKLDQRVLTPVAETGMAPGALGRKLLNSAIARQLNLHYHWAVDGPIKVAVPGYGTFYIGPKGWRLK